MKAEPFAGAAHFTGASMDTEKKLLVIDDEPAIREGVRRILESDSYKVETFASGQAALERIKQEAFDLVITDLKMPGLSGTDVLKSIKEIHPDLPVIFITGYSSVDNAVEVMKLGAVDYIAKPFTPEEMLRVIKTALEQRVVALEDLYLLKELRDNDGFERFVGKSHEMVKVYRRIMQVAPTDRFIWRQKEIDFRTSTAAIFWGVVTITAPSAPSRVWQTESGSSPVPGGESTIR